VVRLNSGCVRGDTKAENMQGSTYFVYLQGLISRTGCTALERKSVDSSAAELFQPPPFEPQKSRAFQFVASCPNLRSLVLHGLRGVQLAPLAKLKHLTELEIVELNKFDGSALSQLEGHQAASAGALAALAAKPSWLTAILIDACATDIA